MRVADKIPDPPRTPRFGAILRKWFVFGVIGISITGLSVPIIAVFLAIGVEILPFEDSALDASAERAFGTVTSVERTSIHFGSVYYDQVAYRLEFADGAATEDSMLAARGSFSIGDSATIEYLPDDPEVSRLSGHPRSPGGWGFRIALGGILLPGVVMLLLWLRGVVSLRLLLSTGRASTASIVAAPSTKFVNPPHLKVTFEFPTSSGTMNGHHWIRRRSKLGRLLDGGAIEVPVVYDEGNPENNRLVLAADFA